MSEDDPGWQPIPEHIREVRTTMMKQSYTWAQVKKVLKQLQDQDKDS